MSELRMMTLGERLRALRETQELSQRALAERVHAQGGERVKLTAPYLSRIEKGERYPSPRVIDALAVALGVQPAFLESGENTWTAVFASGQTALVRAETPEAAMAGLARQGMPPPVVMIPGRVAVAWTCKEEKS